MEGSDQTVRRGIFLCAWILAVFGFLAAGSSWAGGLYTFTDARGTIHFSDRPQDMRYRLKVLPRGGLALDSKIEVTRHELDKIIRRVSLDHDVDPALVKAVIAAESNFQASAVSRAGAVGLMQLMPATAADMGVEAPFEPRQNVRGGVRYLKLLLKRFDSLEHALAAYNAGPETVDRHDGIPPYPETRAYVARVLRFYSRYRSVELFAKREN
ncbi:MAG: transglycosylase SLT domain-containing protein [Myxococcota bacterium]|nr:transglycosylase SLT domain-containing protein [Myxococcota bacterium]